MNKFIYKRSILNVATLIWLILGIIFMVEHVEDIGNELGQGMSTSLIWIGLAFVAIIVDILLQYFIKKSALVNLIEGILVLAFALFVWAFVIV